MCTICRSPVCGASVHATGFLLKALNALQFASGKPSGLVDWNNNYGKDPDKCVLFIAEIGRKIFFARYSHRYGSDSQDSAGRRKHGRSARRPDFGGPVTYARISTNDLSGKIYAYAGEGMFTDDPLNTFGTKAVVRVPRLQLLMQPISARDLSTTSQ